MVCGIKKAVLADGKLSLHEDKLFAGGNGNILLSVKLVNIGEKICFHIGILKPEADSLMEFYLTDRVAHQTGDWPACASVITPSYPKISARSCIFTRTVVWAERLFQIASNGSGEQVPLEMMSHQVKDLTLHLLWETHQLATQDTRRDFIPTANCPSLTPTDVERTLKRAYEQVESC